MELYPHRLLELATKRGTLQKGYGRPNVPQPREIVNMVAGLYCVRVKLAQLTGIHSGVHLSLLAANNYQKSQRR